MEQPNFPLWQRRHARLKEINPDEYKAKYDTRRAYQGIVLQYLQYDPALLNQKQWTWPQPFVPVKGPPTAWGIIRGTSEPSGRWVFLVEACDKRKRDIYKVVFSKDGTFITAISKTAKDVRGPKFPLRRRGAAALLRLNEQVPDGDLRCVTEEAIKAVLSPQSAKFANRSEAVWNVYIRRAIRLDLMFANVCGPRFIYGQEKLGWKFCATALRTSIKEPGIGEITPFPGPIVLRLAERHRHKYRAI